MSDDDRELRECLSACLTAIKERQDQLEGMARRLPMSGGARNTYIGAARAVTKHLMDWAETLGVKPKSEVN